MWNVVLHFGLGRRGKLLISACTALNVRVASIRTLAAGEMSDVVLVVMQLCHFYVHGLVGVVGFSFLCRCARSTTKLSAL